MRTPRWNPTDRRHFADRNILRSWRIPNKRTPPPQPDEWDTNPDDDLEEPTP